jgi:VanZ family protein
LNASRERDTGRLLALVGSGPLMAPHPIWGWSSAWRHWYLRALPAYWVFLFLVLHFPKLKIPDPLPTNDRVLHASAFAILAFLFWRFGEAIQRPVSAGFVWLAAAALVPYALVDEYLQQFVGRTTDWRDALANVTGLAVALVLLEWRRRTVAARGAAARNSFA